jgi:hypothetical protein
VLYGEEKPLTWLVQSWVVYDVVYYTIIYTYRYTTLILVGEELQGRKTGVLSSYNSPMIFLDIFLNDMAKYLMILFSVHDCPHTAIQDFLTRVICK